MFWNNNSRAGRPEDWQAQRSDWRDQKSAWKDTRPDGSMRGTDAWTAWKDAKPAKPEWMTGAGRQHGGMGWGGNPTTPTTPTTPTAPAPDLGVNAGGWITNAQTGQQYQIPNGLDQEGYRQALLGWGFAPSPYI